MNENEKIIAIIETILNLFSFPGRGPDKYLHIPNHLYCPTCRIYYHEIWAARTDSMRALLYGLGIKTKGSCPLCIKREALIKELEKLRK